MHNETCITVMMSIRKNQVKNLTIYLYAAVCGVSALADTSYIKITICQ